MRILIAEDDPVSRRLLQATLTKWGYEVVVCVNGTEAWESLQSDNAPRLAILDWMMPGLDGLQVCRKVRERGSEPYFYMLLLTAKIQKEDVVAGMDAGADDYVTKPFDAHELKVRLRAGQRLLDLQNELIAAREALRVQATHDALTGLFNRVTILDTMKRELARARRDNTNLGAAMIDLDHFKGINDTFGHLTGDHVLREASKRMQLCLRTYDDLGRYGGEEFLVILPSCDLRDSVVVAERIRAGLANTPFVLSDGKPLLVTASMGVISTSVIKEPTVDNLIHAADAALYRAKNGGRNRIMIGEEKDATPVNTSGQ
jgi:two-component system cell cycle response regulator